MRLEYGEVECGSSWQPGIFVEDGVDLRGNDTVDPLRAGGDRCAVRGCSDIERHLMISEHEPKSIVEVDKTSWNSQGTPPRLSITDGDDPEP